MLTMRLALEWADGTFIYCGAYDFWILQINVIVHDRAQDSIQSL